MLKYARDLFCFDRGQLAIRAAVRCLPGVAIPLVLGVALHHPGIGIFAASGAMSVGFGSYQQLRTSRSAPMFFAAIGMSLSTVAGSLAGHTLWAVLLTVALWGFACGFTSSLGKASSYIGLQCVIAMLVTSHYMAPASAAVNRALMVLVGGVGQTLLVRFLWRIEHATAPIPDAASTGHVPSAVAVDLKILFNDLTYRSDAFQYGLRLSVALVYATCLCLWLGLTNGYWLPMTVAIVLKPSFQNTVQRGLARIVGTVVGAGLATLLGSALHPNQWILVTLTVLFAGLSYLLLSVNYAAFAACITSYIVFLLCLAGLPEQKVVHYRMLNTALGGTMALLMHARVTRTRDTLAVPG